MIELKLTKDEIDNMVELLNSFYNFSDITDYYLKKKLEKLKRLSVDNIEDDLFNDFNINPNDLEIVIEDINSKDWYKYVARISTFPIENQIGRQIYLSVKDKKTNKYLGFIRLASPIISIKPRNEYIGYTISSDKINKHIYNGQTIVPVQPFGYNYLGGKLLSLICISNEVRQIYDKKYNTEICLFETTSLYGSTKSSSMYDGMDRYIKFKGKTESKNLLSPTDDIFNKIKMTCREKYGMLVPKKGSAPKSREFNKIIQIIKEHLKHYDIEGYNNFKDFVNTKMKTIQQKRYYVSDMGFSNSKEYILNGDDLLFKDLNNNNLNNLIDWWKIKSFRRWDTLNNKNLIQKELEIYTIENIENNNLFKIIR